MGPPKIYKPVDSSGREGKTEPERTKILDPTGAPVTITKDTFNRGPASAPPPRE